MRAERSQRIGQLLQAALQWAPGERPKFLADACGGDQTLRQEVESLLSTVPPSIDPAATNAATLPESGHAAWQQTAAFAPAGVNEQGEPGLTLDHYVLLGRLGRGGMGVVYAAYDPELNRKVAIKLLRPDRVDPDSGLRILREAQAMARLSHPNVISVYHVGTWRDQVFVVMEYVEGGTLRGWLSEQSRPVKEIVSVFVQAGRGLAAAHAAGLLHRDFKPDNVLLGKDGRARVIDFGLARAVEGDVAFASSLPSESPGAIHVSSGSPLDISLTRTGAVFGTPAYMAPEQRNGSPTNARTDQYSFCVALYEALYGERPLAREVKEPAPAGESAHLSERSKSRRAPAWIRAGIMRGLQPDSAERFPSMDALLEALTTDPAVKRRRTWGATLGVLLVAGVSVAFWQVARQRGLLCRGAEKNLAGVWDSERKNAVARTFRALAKPYGEDALRGVERVLDSYSERWVKMHTEACEATRIRGVQSEELLDLRMGCLSQRRQELRALSELLSQADAKLMAKAVDASQALTPLAECADAKALTAPVRPPADAATRAKVQQVRNKLAVAKAHDLAGQYAEELRLETSAAAEAKEIHYRPLEAEALGQLGELQKTKGDLKAAEATFKEALRAALASGHDLVSAQVWTGQVGLNIKRTRYQDADEAANNALAALERVGGNEVLLAPLLNDLGALREGEAKYDEAVANHQRALEIRKRLYGPIHRDVAQSMNNLGIAFARLGNDDQALEYYRGALSVYEQTLGPRHSRLSLSLNNIGNVLRRQGKLEESRASYERAVAIVEQAEGPDAPDVALPLDNLGIVVRLQGKFEEALALHRRALKIRQGQLGDSHPDVGATLEHIGTVLVEQKKPSEALGYFERQLAIDEKALGAEHPWVANDLVRLGRLHLDLHQPEQAVALLERALQLREARPAKGNGVAEARFALARALRQNGRDPSRSRSLALQARETYAGDPDKNAKTLSELDAWLAAKR